jgi:hypothetical protein
VHLHTLTATDLYTLEPTGKTWDLVRQALKSFAIWGFYLPLLFLAAVAVYIIEPEKKAGSAADLHVYQQR